MQVSAGDSRRLLTKGHVGGSVPTTPRARAAAHSNIPTNDRIVCVCVCACVGEIERGGSPFLTYPASATVRSKLGKGEMIVRATV